MGCGRLDGYALDASVRCPDSIFALSAAIHHYFSCLFILSTQEVNEMETNKTNDEGKVGTSIANVELKERGRNADRFSKQASIIEVYYPRSLRWRTNS